MQVHQQTTDWRRNDDKWLFTATVINHEWWRQW